LQDNQGPLLPEHHSHLKSLDSQDLPLLHNVDQWLHQPQQLPLQPVNLHYNLASAQYHKLTLVQLAVFNLLLDLNQFKQVDPNKVHQEMHRSQHSVTESHSSSRVNLDQHFNNHSKQDQVVNHNSLHLDPGLDNLKQDHLKVLQLDHHHKDSNKDLSNLERPGPLPLEDFNKDLQDLPQDSQYLTQQLLEVLDSKLCETYLKHTQGTLKRLLYSCYYIYALRLWMCINENMLVLLAIILFMLSKTRQTSCQSLLSFPHSN
jgi:hypothetical protein